MGAHFQSVSSNHPSGGTPEQSALRCCARCRRGTPATGLGECGYGDQGCPNTKCGCHKPLPESVHTVHLSVDGRSIGSMSREAYDEAVESADLLKGIIQHDFEAALAHYLAAALRETGTPE